MRRIVVSINIDICRELYLNKNNSDNLEKLDRRIASSKFLWTPIKNFEIFYPIKIRKFHPRKKKKKILKAYDLLESCATPLNNASMQLRR